MYLFQAAAQNDFSNSISSQHPIQSICDKLLGLSFSRLNGVTSSTPYSLLPLMRSTLPCVLDMILPAMLQQSDKEPSSSDSENSMEDAETTEEEKWPGIEAIFSSYIKFHKGIIITSSLFIMTEMS